MGRIAVILHFADEGRQPDAVQVNQNALGLARELGALYGRPFSTSVDDVVIDVPLDDRAAERVDPADIEEAAAAGLTQPLVDPGDPRHQDPHVDGSLVEDAPSDEPVESEPESADSSEDEPEAPVETDEEPKRGVRRRR